MDDLTRHVPTSIKTAMAAICASEDLHTKEKWFRLLVERTTDVIWSADMNLRWTYVSPSVKAFLGFTQEESLTHAFTEVLTPVSTDLVTNLLAKIIAAAEHDQSVLDQSHTMELEFLRKDGDTVWAEVRASIFRDEMGHPAGIVGVTRDISDRKRTEMALRESEQRYRMLAETTSDWVWEIDRCGVYTYASPKIRGLLGYEPEEVIGKTPFDLMPPAEAKRVAESFGAIAGCHVSFVALENTVLHKNGSRVVVESSGIPLFDHAGEFVGYQGCDRDVTDQKRWQRELKDAKTSAEACTRAKSEFLANVSHEIRTPMTAILGFADILQENLRSPEDIEAAGTIKRNGDYLMSLVNDILDHSKIEAGKMIVERIACSPMAIVADVLALMRSGAAAKGLPLEVQCVGPIPETIQSDPVRLRQILINLIGNAVKFTDSGMVRVSLRLLESDGGTEKMRFDIADTGAGIAPKLMAGLFQPFVQGDPTANRKFGGTGLGLVISKRLAELLGGNIVVSSRLGKGSTFSLTVDTGPLGDVPMIASEAAEHVQLQPRDDGVATFTTRKQLHCRLLLAEDGPDNQRLIALLLTSAGADVSLADNGLMAVELAMCAEREAKPFNLILMDMQMPLMDGYQATRRLRAQGFAAPIIALTAHAMSGDRKKCLEAGCDNYIAKPVERSTLLEMVSRYVDGQAAGEAAIGRPCEEPSATCLK